MKMLIAASCLGLALATPASAQDRIYVGKSAGEQVDEALESVLSALRLVMRAIPQYELPEVLPNGDIIIRRIPPEPDPKNGPQQPKPEKQPGTDT
jgi:hypothetical protein